MIPQSLADVSASAAVGDSFDRSLSNSDPRKSPRFPLPKSIRERKRFKPRMNVQNQTRHSL